MVIVNRGTAGAAEIAAAALLDSKRAERGGRAHLRRRGGPQAVTMDDGSAVILSVAKYYSPDGKAIQDTGVTPNVLTGRDGCRCRPTDDDDADDDGASRPKAGPDEIMKRAINGRRKQQ